MTQTQPQPPRAHPDFPPVAEIESGGPPTSPGYLAPPQKFDYEPVPGFFVQTQGGKQYSFEPDLLARSFGLLDSTPERWGNLDKAVKQLNAEAPAGVAYKVLFLGRHGQGWHNFGASKYGIDPWEDKWTYLNGDGEITWGPDPELTPEGVRQAREIQKVWKKEVKFGAPVNNEVMRWYVSPLTRTGQTMLESFGELLTGTPEVWEDWREIYGSHTCDKRSTRSYIAKRFPTFQIEEGFAEEDPLWTADYRETDESMQVRSRNALDRIFDEQTGAEEIYISVTSHSAIFRNTLAVLNHQPYPLATGEMIPVVVKATRVGGANGNGNGPNGVNGH